MGSDKNDLELLWQQQSVQHLDIKKIERQFKSQRRKQRCYLIADIFSLLPLAYVLIFMQEKLSKLAFVLIAVIGLISVVYVGALIYFRRHAVFHRHANTHDYLSSLRKQMLNNVLIARLTRHFCWVVLLGIAAFYGILYWADELNPERGLTYSLVLVASVISTVACYVWAHKREKRFQAEAERLEALNS